MLVPSRTNVYYVIVTAVRGGQKSDSCESDIFSFHKYATTAQIKCMFSLYYWLNSEI